MLHYLKALLLLPLCAPLTALATTYISNLDQVSNNYPNDAVEGTVEFAQSFTAGTSSGGYTLNSVQIIANGASQTPPFTLSLYSSVLGQPGLSLGPLTGSNPGNTFPPGTYTYTPAAPIALLPSTQYWLVAASPTGTYDWILADNLTYTASDGWSINSSKNWAESINSGTTWAVGFAENFAFDIDATAIAVPEPSTLITCALGALVLLSCKRRMLMRRQDCE